MPTAEQFDTMAAALDGFDEHLGAVPGGVIQAVKLAAIAGGTVGPLVSSTVDATMLNLTTARAHIAAAAALCRDRAEQCRRYTMLLDGHDFAMDDYISRASGLEPGDHLGSPPSGPRRPGTWADRG